MLKQWRHILILILALGSQGKLLAQPCGNNSPFAYAGDDSTICSSHNIVYLNAVLKKANGLTWGGGTGDFFPDNTSATTNYVPSQAEIDAGYVTLFVYTTGNGNCSPHRDTVQITILSAPESPITGPDKICEYSSGNTYSVPSLTGGSYSWHVVGGTIASGSGTNSVSVNWGSAGPGYLYLVQTDSNGCQGVGSIDPISRFNFSTDDLANASVGPDAVSYDSDAHTNGYGMYISGNCGSSKGLDLELSGSTLDRGKMCMTFSWQRDESQASFFKRGNTEFYIDGGVLKIKLEQSTASGSNVIGPVSTGYTVPNDDVFRYFTFCYDSASGIARVLVNDSIAFEYNTGSNSSLYWTGAGNAMLGTIMDGSCSKKALLDWINIAIPISIVPKPGAEITGDSALCINTSGSYSADTLSLVRYTWTANGGTILSGQSSPNIDVLWTSASASLSLYLADTVNGCDSIVTYYPQINTIAHPGISGEDSVCTSEEVAFSAGSNSFIMTWAASGSPTNYPYSTADSFGVSYSNAGVYYINLSVSDTVSGCSNEDSVALWVNSWPTPSINGPDILCLGSSELFSTSTNTNQYSWYVDANASIQSGSGSSEVSILGSAVGMVNITLIETDPYFGCSTSDNKTVEVKPIPVTSPIQY